MEGDLTFLEEEEEAGPEPTRRLKKGLRLGQAGVGQLAVVEQLGFLTEEIRCLSQDPAGLPLSSSPRSPLGHWAVLSQ